MKMSPTDDVLMAVLPRDFYARPTLEVARDLIGKVLVHESRRRHRVGRHCRDRGLHRRSPIRHAMRRPARPPQCAALRSAGFAYVYLNYGIHYLVNAVTEAGGLAGRRADPRARTARRRAADAAAARARHRPPGRSFARGGTMPRPRQPDTRAGHFARSKPARSDGGPLVSRIAAWPPRDVEWSRASASPSGWSRSGDALATRQRRGVGARLGRPCDRAAGGCSRTPTRRRRGSVAALDDRWP